MPYGLIYEGVSETPLKVSGVDVILMKYIRMHLYGETVKLILRLLNLRFKILRLLISCFSSRNNVFTMIPHDNKLLC